MAWPKHDYGYRLIVEKAIWAAVLNEMVMEQNWNNFKNEASRHVAETGKAYIEKLHNVWWEMQRCGTRERFQNLDT